MQVSDKLIKPLTEVKYLNADNVSRYRCIMRIFFENYEKLKYWLYQEDVYEEMMKVTLKNLSIAEKEELEGFFGRSYHGQKSITVSSDKFCTVLENSRYKGITPEMLLETYFHEPLMGKKDELQIKERK